MIFGDAFGGAIGAAKQGQTQLLAGVGLGAGQQSAAAPFQRSPQVGIIRQLQEPRVEAGELLDQRVAFRPGEPFELLFEMDGEQLVKRVPFEVGGERVGASRRGEHEQSDQDERSDEAIP